MTKVQWPPDIKNVESGAYVWLLLPTGGLMKPLAIWLEVISLLFIEVLRIFWYAINKASCDLSRILGSTKFIKLLGLNIVVQSASFYSEAGVGLSCHVYIQMDFIT